MSLTAVPVILIVAALRLGLCRAPKKYSYALWLAVGFRLVCPVALTGVLGQEAGVTALLPQALPATTERVAAGVSRVDYGLVPVMTGGAQTLKEAAVSTAAVPDWSAWLALAWAAGVCALAVRGLIVYAGLRRRMATAVRLEGNVYESDVLTTPFVMGLIRPRIYIPFRLTGEERSYVLSHERCHIRRADHLVRMIAYLVASVYWMNPLVWVCYYLMNRDMEMSCDEAVLGRMGDEIKKGYSMSLVSFATTRRIPAAGLLTFGEGDAKKRIKNVLRWKKETPRVAFLAIIICVFAIIVCLGNGNAGAGWIRGGETETTDGSGMTKFSYSVNRDVWSMFLYEEVYDDGELISGQILSTTDFTIGQRPDQGTLEIGYEMENWPQLNWLQKDGSVVACLPSHIPERDYHAMIAKTLSSSSGKVDLPSDGSCTIYLISLAEDAAKGLRPIGPGDLDAGGPEELKDNGVVAALRLITSTKPIDDALEQLGASAWAYRLFDAATPYVGDAPGCVDVLFALRLGDELGDFSIELETSKQPYGMQINFRQSPQDPETMDGAMGRYAPVLIALIGNLDQVRWTYPAENGALRQAEYTYDEGVLDQVREATGRAYGSLKEMGDSPQGVQDLLQGLGLE
nr:M56 family metallopeptidase [Dysosmobacter acutus]